MYLTYAMLAWINLRSVSFGLDHLWNKKQASLLNRLAYCFYFPVGVGGPRVLPTLFSFPLLKKESSISEMDLWTLAGLTVSVG